MIVVLQLEKNILRKNCDTRRFWCGMCIAVDQNLGASSPVSEFKTIDSASHHLSKGSTSFVPIQIVMKIDRLFEVLGKWSFLSIYVNWIKKSSSTLSSLGIRTFVIIRYRALGYD